MQIKIIGAHNSSLTGVIIFLQTNVTSSEVLLEEIDLLVYFK